MKNKEITIKVLQFENGDILLAVDSNTGDSHVKTVDGVFIYSDNEMIEIYAFNPNE